MKSYLKFALYVAICYGAVWFLMTKTGFGPKVMTITASQNQDKILKVFMLVGGSPQKPTGDGTTPLHAAAYEESDNAVAFLLEKGVDVDAVDEQGRTPLHLAAYNGHVGTIILLIEGGADTEIGENTDDMTPLHVAVLRKKKEAIKKLLAMGARVNARTSQGLTAAGLANEEGNSSLAAYLSSKSGR